MAPQSQHITHNPLISTLNFMSLFRHMDQHDTKYYMCQPLELSAIKWHHVVV